MSDELVQEKTETAAVALGNGHAEENSSGAAAAETLSPTAVTSPEPAAEPESPQSAADPGSADAETPVSAAPSDEDTAAFEREMQSLDIGSRYAESFRQLEADKVVVGTVMRVDREGVLVDVGAKSEGIIRLNELSRDAGPNVNPENIVKVGEQIRVYVLEPENQDGIPVLSKKRADFEVAWDNVQKAKETGEVITAMVTDRVKGGLVVDLGIRGFVPASHVGSGSLKNNLDKYVGQTMLLKVIEVDKDRRKVVLSNKLAQQEEREQRSRELRASLAPNQIRRGIVRRLTNYGAFVDLGGIDGLLHISEMSWTRINDPKEVLREGQEIDVLVLSVNLESNRVSLSLRQILPDPWKEITSRYKEGDVITGTVTRTVPFGAFVQVEGGIEGIIPNSEMLRNRSGKGSVPLAPNEEVTVKVINLKPEERKMTLSLRALAPPEETEMRPAPESSGGSGGSGGGGKRRRGRDRDVEEGQDDYSRYTRQEEPRFTIGDAFAAAQRRDKPKRDRRSREEYEEEDLGDLELEEEAALEEETLPEENEP
jgi:predicted RNA-binding protein with RPS1 domain